MERHIGIVGSTGAIGASVARALDTLGRPYETIARSRASRVWDPDDRASIEAAFRGLDTLVYCVGVDYTKFALHPKLMRATIDGATAAGVERILMIGNVYPYGRVGSNPVREDQPRNPHTFKGRMRKEQEDLLMGAHAQGALQGAVLRLPDFYGPGTDKSFLSNVFTAAAKGGTAQLIGPVDRPHQYVYIPDVGAVVARMIDEPLVWGKYWHFAGAGIITPVEFAKKIFAAAGRPYKAMIANLFMLRVMGLFNPFMRELVEMNYLQSEPVILDDAALRSLLGDLHATSYDDGIRETLAAEA